MSGVKSNSTFVFKRFFLFRLLARLFWAVDLLAFLFAPVIFLAVFAVVHLVIYRFYLLAFVDFHSCFVYPEE